MNPRANPLPPVVRRFLAAANGGKAARAAVCFAPQATVRDEDRDYEGRTAIEAWVAETSRKYQPTYTPLRCFVRPDVARVQVAVSGHFPGSPVNLDYTLCLRQGKISALTIT